MRRMISEKQLKNEINGFQPDPMAAYEEAQSHLGKEEMMEGHLFLADGDATMWLEDVTLDFTKHTVTSEFYVQTEDWEQISEEPAVIVCSFPETIENQEGYEEYIEDGGDLTIVSLTLPPLDSYYNLGEQGNFGAWSFWVDKSVIETHTEEDVIGNDFSATDEYEVTIIMKTVTSEVDEDRAEWYYDPSYGSDSFSVQIGQKAFQDHVNNNPWNFYGYFTGNLSGNVVGNVIGQLGGDSTSKRKSAYVSTLSASGTITGKNYYLQSQHSGSGEAYGFSWWNFGTDPIISLKGQYHYNEGHNQIRLHVNLMNLAGPGLVVFDNALPTSDPGVEGALWEDNGVLKISHPAP